jgi:hypothetical protein
MKIGKQFLGKEVRITWLDPFSERTMLDKAKKGKAALAKWIERGVIDDFTDGIVRLVQSQAFSPGQNDHDEAIVGWIPEELIEICELMEPAKEGS